MQMLHGVSENSTVVSANAVKKQTGGEQDRFSLPVILMPILIPLCVEEEGRREEKEEQKTWKEEGMKGGGGEQRWTKIQHFKWEP